MQARYDNPAHTEIRIVDSVVDRCIPAVVGNRHYDDLIASGVAIAPYVPPAPTADDVRRECRHRMMALLGARDADHLATIISNGNREGLRLLSARAAWTPADAERAARLAQIDAAIEALRSASNALEAAPPTDFTDNRHWPA